MNSYDNVIKLAGYPAIFSIRYSAGCHETVPRASVASVVQDQDPTLIFSIMKPYHHVTLWPQSCKTRLIIFAFTVFFKLAVSTCRTGSDCIHETLRKVIAYFVVCTYTSTDTGTNCI
jgi:hypothetical protein